MTVVLISLGLGVLAACGSDDAESSATTDEPAITEAATTTEPPMTTAEAATTTTKATSTTDLSTTTAAPTTAQPATTTEAPEFAWADDCFDGPMPPPFLQTGAAPGEPVLGETTGGSVTATWGADTPDEITQVLTDAPDRSFEIAGNFDEILMFGRFEAAVVPVGPPSGPLSISIRDSDQACTRQYQTPGTLGEDGIDGSMDEADADDFARSWLEALNS